MEHSFDIELAKEIGIIPAILLKHLYFWVKKNRANERHIHAGKAWTYNSKKAFSVIFPYLTERQIQYALDMLKKMKLIDTGHFSQDKWDKTLWYTITTEGENKFVSIDRTKLSDHDRTKLSNDARDIGTININTDINTDIRNKEEMYKEDETPESTKKMVIYPATPEEVILAAAERSYMMSIVEATNFLAAYAAAGWTFKDGRKIIKWEVLLDRWKLYQNSDQRRDASAEWNERRAGRDPYLLARYEYYTDDQGRKWRRTFGDESAEWEFIPEYFIGDDSEKYQKSVM